MPRLDELIVEKKSNWVNTKNKKADIKKVFLVQENWKDTVANVFYWSGENFNEASLSLNKLYTMDDKAFSKKINEMKKMQFDNLNYEPSKELLNFLKEKKQKILDLIQNPISWERLKYLNKLNNSLRNAFDENNKKDYTKWYQRLPDFTNKRIENWYYKVLISNVRKNDIGICLGKIKKESEKNPKKIIEESIKYDIPNENLIGSDYLRWDEIVIEFKKTWDKINIKEVDKRYYELQKKWLLNRKIDYLPQSSSKIVSGKIVWLWEDKKWEEVIFEQENWNKFALKIETLLKWIQKPEKIKEKKIEIKKPEIQQKVVIEKKNNSHVVIKKPSVSKIVYDWSQEVCGRDWEEIIYKNQK